MWTPPIELTPREEKICSRLTKQRRFFPFLRRHRHCLFDADFQTLLATMYSDKPRGTPPMPPAFLATVVLLQAYTRCSDFDAVSNAHHDVRWQMVLGLDCLDDEKAPFGEATLVDFRARLVSTGMTSELLRRTVDLARETKGFGFKQAAGLRIAIDSAPLDGAGKVEDTINLLGRSLRLLLRVIAAFVVMSPGEVAAQARLPLLVAPSIKAGLDLDWHEPHARSAAVDELVAHMERLTGWIQQRLAPGLSTLALEAARRQVDRIVAQDLEPDGAGGKRIREGVAPDRQISISDPEMRHGRKSKTERIDGYKEYVARDLDNDLTLAAGVLPANVPEMHGADKLRSQIAVFGEVKSLSVDCAFLKSELFAEVRARLDGEVICRALRPARLGFYVKTDFDIDLAAQVVRCPAHKLAVIQSGHAHFATADCSACESRAKCQPATAKAGRSISIHPDEALQQEFRAAQKTPEGRARLRQRVPVEHALSHQRAPHGRFARYHGVKKNDFDSQRIAAMNNLQTIDRRVRKSGVEELGMAA
jgi:Transposase DDE domain/Transposase domain (DUF772)